LIKAADIRGIENRAGPKNRVSGISQPRRPVQWNWRTHGGKPRSRSCLWSIAQMEQVGRHRDAAGCGRRRRLWFPVYADSL